MRFSTWAARCGVSRETDESPHLQLVASFGNRPSQVFMRHTPLGLLLLAASEAAPSFWRLKQAHLVSEPECEVADECSEPWEVCRILACAPQPV